MGSTVTLGRVWGIPIRLHWTFLLVLPLFAYLMGQAYFAEGPGTLTDFAWGSALAVALFGSVVLHELGHSWTAHRYDVPVESITLLPIGGVAQMERTPDDPGQEFRVALAGPVVSIGLGVPIFTVQWLGLVPELLPQLGRFVFWLGTLNVFLGVFNLLPAFPMDGGRLLRAGLTGRLGRRRATEVSAGIGRVLAIGMGLVGFFNLSGGGWILLLIALFIYLGASQEERQVQATATLGGLTVAEIMTRDPRTVGPDATVEDVYDRMLETRHLAFPVVEAGRVVGLVGLEDVADVARQDHSTRLVRDVMRTEFTSAEPGRPARELLGDLARQGPGRLVVVEEDGRMVGIVSRTDLVRLVQILDSEERSGVLDLTPGGPPPP